MSVESRVESRAVLGGVVVGDGVRVAVMGALNVSPESFYCGSVYRTADDLRRAADAMIEGGAALLDVGAMSTAPYLETAIAETEESERLATAVETLARTVTVPISADTTRAGPARAALDAGASVINDVSGLADPALGRLVAERSVSIILVAHPQSAHTAAPSRGGPPAEPAIGATAIEIVTTHLVAARARARMAEIAEERTVLDPGIGFFLDDPAARAGWDLTVLAGLGRLATLGRPLCVGVSRKSFIGSVTGRRNPAERLAGSLAAVTVAVLNGAALIRTHDVHETVDVVRMAERLRGMGPP